MRNPWADSRQWATTPLEAIARTLLGQVEAEIGRINEAIAQNKAALDILKRFTFRHEKKTDREAYATLGQLIRDGFGKGGYVTWE